MARGRLCQVANSSAATFVPAGLQSAHVNSRFSHRQIASPIVGWRNMSGGGAPRLNVISARQGALCFGEFHGLSSSYGSTEFSGRTKRDQLVRCFRVCRTREASAQCAVAEDRRTSAPPGDDLAKPSVDCAQDWRPVGDSNPCYRRERPASWASRRTGRERPYSYKRRLPRIQARYQRCDIIAARCVSWSFPVR
jgi:hypothetical protein